MTTSLEQLEGKHKQILASFESGQRRKYLAMLLVVKNGSWCTVFDVGAGEKHTYYGELSLDSAIEAYNRTEPR